MPWNLGPQNLDWVSPSRIFATTQNLLDSQPNYEHEVAITLDTGTKYQGIAPVVGGWRYASGAPGPYPPAPDPAPTNDGFTKLFLGFEGIENSVTLEDTNVGVWPRKWTRSGFAGFGAITNVNEKFDEGSLHLDGHTIYWAPDELRWIFDGDFTIRGWFTVEFPLEVTARYLFAKSDEALNTTFSFWVRRMQTGEINVGVGIDQDLNNGLVDRNGVLIVDRNGGVIFSRYDYLGLPTSFQLQSVTKYTDTLNPGWHEFVYSRVGTTQTLKMDGVVEDTETGAGAPSLYTVGPLVIGGWKRDMLPSAMWIGGVDRLAIDVGIGR